MKPYPLPLVNALENRGDDTTRDSQLVNGYWEPQVDHTVHIVKRPGLVKYAAFGFDVTWGTEQTVQSGTGFVGLGGAYGASVFCMVGERSSGAAIGTSYTSPDGITWTVRTMPSSQVWSDVAWSSTLGLFCAVAQGNITAGATSPDGITWTAITLPAASNWFSVTWGNNLFVAVGYDGGTGTPRIATSYDGSTWTLRTVPGAVYLPGTTEQVVWNGTVFIWQCGIISSTTYVYSSDGITWTAGTYPVAKTYRLAAVSDSNICVVDSTNVALVSTDGINWTQYTLPASHSWNALDGVSAVGFCLTYSDGITNYAYTSVDGSSWRSNDISGTAVSTMRLMHNTTDFLAFAYYSVTSTALAWLGPSSGISHSGAGAGLYNWNGDVYAVFGTTLYKNGTSLGTVDGTGGKYSFNSVLGATPRLFLHNGVKGYYYDSSGGLSAAIAAFPGPTVKGATYLDGTEYVMTSAPAVRGSDINDLTAWSALNTITPQIEPSIGIAIAKQRVYVVALKKSSIEILYDKSNPTGSPLGPLPSAKVSVGCRQADSVQDIDGVLCWISETNSGSVGVMLMENLKAVPVDTPAVSRLLQDWDYTTIYSWQARVGGHRFYVITSIVSNMTLAYDLTTQRWSRWADASGNYVPIIDSTYDSNQRVILQHATNGTLYKFSNTQYSDDGTVFSVDIYTPNFNGEVELGKYCKRLAVDCDQQNGSVLYARVSDDDYQTWTDFRELDLSQQKPYLEDMGTFVRRAHHFRHTANTAFRMKAAIMLIDICTI